jgi:U4/U6 small nuclear ribonucleoprotein PRP3
MLDSHKIRFFYNYNELGSSESVPSIVIVEGGPKGIKFYKKLLLRRMRWNLSNNFEVKSEMFKV